MRTPIRLAKLFGFVAFLFPGKSTFAQEPHVAPSPAKPKAGHTKTVSQVRVVGNFQRMQHMKDFGAKGAIRDVVPAKGGYAVGALAGLEGEITAYDGITFLSYGKTMDGRIATQESGKAEATLLVAAKVDAWTEVPIPTALSQEELHAFIVSQAEAAGFDVAEAFPFLIRGEITNHRWHVVAAPNPLFRGHGGKAPMAERFEADGERMAAEVVGFYSGVRLSGVISHPGEKFHEHVLDPDRTVMGHLDAYEIGAGATLFLPA